MKEEDIEKIIAEHNAYLYWKLSSNKEAEGRKRDYEDLKEFRLNP